MWSLLLNPLQLESLHNLIRYSSTFIVVILLMCSFPITMNQFIN